MRGHDTDGTALVYHSFSWSRDWNRTCWIVGSNGDGTDLIVLCPSFSGQTGTYQATAIALASDILGSAVTTYTYAKNKNIDLKRGWIMLVCILTMCTVGSYAAFLAGNVVLGSFTLFLTFSIGIRFLIKPDTSRKEQAAKGEKLDWKGIAISLFFGITIGFGTGFVGTGGG